MKVVCQWAQLKMRNAIFSRWQSGESNKAHAQLLSPFLLA